LDPAEMMDSDELRHSLEWNEYLVIIENARHFFPIIY